MYIFVLMVVEASGQPYVQNLVTELATSPPWGTIGHNSERPLGFPRPDNRGQRSGLKTTSWGAVLASQLHHSRLGLQLCVECWEWKVKITSPLTLSAYMPDRLSIRSVIASLLLRTTISWPKTRKCRTSVAFRGRPQSDHG